LFFTISTEEKFMFKVIIPLVLLVLGVLFAPSIPKASGADGFLTEVYTTTEVPDVLTATYVDSISGKGLMTIGQMHLSSLNPDNSFEYIQAVASNQKHIATIVTKLKRRHGERVKFCPEGVFDIPGWADELEKDTSLLQHMVRSVSTAYLAGDSGAAKKEYVEWVSLVTEIVPAGAFRQMSLLSGEIELAQLAKGLGTTEFDSLIQGESLHRDLMYAEGALVYLYKTGALKVSDFVICEDEATFQQVGNILYGESKLSEEEIARLAEEANSLREAAYIANAKAVLDRPGSEVNFVVGVYGLMHDMSQQIIDQQKAGELDFGYLYIRPAPLTDEFLERTIK
jgi:hypothetical protein